MTNKQEEIREGVRHIMDDCYNATNPDYPKLRAFQPMKFLNELFPYLHSQGVVLKVDNIMAESVAKALSKFDDVPHNEECHGKDTRLCPRCQLLKFVLAIDNLVAVESLVGD